MYNGENKTAIASQKAIADTMILLLSKKAYSDISISELCKESKVSRQTFYTLFESKENVIVYKIKNNYSFSLENLSTKEPITLEEMCHSYSLYVTENYEFLKLLVSSGLIDILYQCFYEAFAGCNRFMPNECDEQRKYIVTFIVGGLTSIIKKYVTDTPSNDIAFIKKTTYSLFSKTLFEGR